MPPCCLGCRRLTSEHADYQGCATLRRPTLYFGLLFVCHLPPRQVSRPCTIGGSTSMGSSIRLPSSPFIVLPRHNFTGRKGRLCSGRPSPRFLGPALDALVSCVSLQSWPEMSIARRPPSKCVGHPVMRSHRAFRNVYPPFARGQVVAALRMKWIVNPVVRPRRVASHQ